MPPLWWHFPYFLNTKNKMKKAGFLFLTLISNSVFAIDDIEQKLQYQAKPEISKAMLPMLDKRSEIRLDLQKIAQNPSSVRQLLSQAIYSRNQEMIEKLLKIYRTFPTRDLILEQFALGKIAALNADFATAIRHYRDILAQQPTLNPVRIELAIAFFQAQQLDNAKAQFEQAQRVAQLPPPVAQLIAAYLAEIEQRNGWQLDFSAHYVRDSNVNNTSNAAEIEQTGYVKNKNMLPQTAHGVAFNAGLARDFNLVGSHYLAFNTQINGEIYWDNHYYDDVTGRTYLGYAYKTAGQSFRLLPFYERRFMGNNSYRWSNGVRGEISHKFSPHWQLATAAEYGKIRYFDNEAMNGDNKLLSATLVWARNPQQFFTLGTDFIRERTQIKQYNSDTKSLRFGWGQEWQIGGISSRLNLSLSERGYKDVAKLGGFLNLGKVRKDKVYSTTLTLWKRDWHWLGITPKLQFSYRKHDSNLPTLYSYKDKQVNIVFENRF